MRTSRTIRLVTVVVVLFLLFKLPSSFNHDAPVFPSREVATSTKTTEVVESPFASYCPVPPRGVDAPKWRGDAEVESQVVQSSPRCKVERFGPSPVAGPWAGCSSTRQIVAPKGTNYTAFLTRLFEVLRVASVDRQARVDVLHRIVQGTLSGVNGGLVVEFGVFRGDSLEETASAMCRAGFRGVMAGFDSWEGLPEKWRTGFEKGTFATDYESVVRRMAPYVSLQRGWFQDTLPSFLSAHPNRSVTYLHYDGDLLVSTVIVHALLANRLSPGTIVGYDELIGYPSYWRHEALQLYAWLRGSRAKLCTLAHLWGMPSPLPPPPFEVPIDVNPIAQSAFFQVLSYEQKICGAITSGCQCGGTPLRADGVTLDAFIVALRAAPRISPKSMCKTLDNAGVAITVGAADPNSLPSTMPVLSFPPVDKLSLDAIDAVVGKLDRLSEKRATVALVAVNESDVGFVTVALQLMAPHMRVGTTWSFRRIHNDHRMEKDLFVPLFVVARQFGASLCVGWGTNGLDITVNAIHESSTTNVPS